MCNGNNHTVLIIGDIMLDKTYYGIVERISPEAPCPVFNHISRIENGLGGAGYVAKQLSSLQINVFLCGLSANDISGKRIIELAKESNIDTSLIFNTAESTTVKTRFVAGEQNQQVFRYDSEIYHSFNVDEQNTIISFIKNNASVLEQVLLVDYDKGVVNDIFSQTVIRTCKELSICTYVDIKAPSFARYQHAETVKGNLNEIRRLSQSLKIENSFPEIKKELNCKVLIITCGASGVYYLGADNIIHHDITVSRNLFDVTGAGDVVSAFYVASILKGASMAEAVANANRAASIKVGIHGCPVLTWTDISTHNKKLVSVKYLLSFIAPTKKIVFTNGCFDVLHSGHIDLLNAASSFGDVLVVGLNSDKSIRKIKGPNRPINDLESRISVLSALESVDYIVVFDDDTPLSIIQELNPSVLVKGGDYQKHQIVGAEYVEGNGGEVRIIPIVHNISSTKIVNRLI